MAEQREFQLQMPAGAGEIIGTLRARGFEAYAVGGCVRDALLRRTPGDWDITTNALPGEVKGIFGRTIDTGIAHGTVTVLMGDSQYEVTTYRVDGAYEDHRHPKEVTFTRSLSEDLLRRDFTINAMCYNEEEGLIDLYGGMRDLEDGIIRCVGNAKERFTEDALRIMRALRFGAQLDFTLDPDTKEACRELAPTLEMVSRERIRDELMKLITSPHPERIREAYETGVTAVVLPEFDACMGCEQNNRHHYLDVGEHTVKAMCSTDNDPVLRLTMLFHDMGKPATKTTDGNGTDHFYRHPAVSEEIALGIMRRLKFDNRTIARVRNLVRYHDYRMPEGITPAAVRRAAARVGEDFPLLLKVMSADNAAKNPEGRAEADAAIARVTELYEEALKEGAALKVKDLALNGNDLIGAGMKPGAAIGEKLREMLEDVIEHPSHNTKAYLSEHFL